MDLGLQRIFTGTSTVSRRRRSGEIHHLDRTRRTGVAPSKITDPLGDTTKYAYDADGNVESIIDPNGHKTKFTYDADNERTKVERPNGAVEETGYDGAGQVTSQTDGTNTKLPTSAMSSSSRSK